MVERMGIVEDSFWSTPKFLRWKFFFEVFCLFGERNLFVFTEIVTFKLSNRNPN